MLPAPLVLCVLFGTSGQTAGAMPIENSLYCSGLRSVSLGPASQLSLRRKKAGAVRGGGMRRIISL
jgi:hypothetical protein